MLFLNSFANSFKYAVFMRFCLGLVNGQVPVSTAVLMQLAPLEKIPVIIALNQAIANMGNFFGPYIGGMCFGYIESFPFFFPTFVVASLNLLSLFVITWFYQDTV